MKKKKKSNGNEESDAEVLNRILKDIDDKLEKQIKNIDIKFDGRFK